MHLLLVYGLLATVMLAEELLPCAFWPYLSLALLSTFILLLGRRFFTPMAILLPVVMAKLLLALSLLFIGHGLPIRELGIVAQGQVHSAYFALLTAAFLHIAAWVCAALMRAPAPAPIRISALLRGLYHWSVTGAASVAILFLLDTGARQGFALIEGADRFAYRAGQGWFFSIVMTFKPILAGLIGFARFRLSSGRGARSVLSLLFCLLFVASALSGDKFLSLLVMTVFFFMPFFIVQGGLPRRRGRALGMAAVVGLIVSGLTYHVYSDYGALDFQRTAQRLAGRFTGQGQLWYAVMHERPAIVDVDRAEGGRIAGVMMAREADQAAFERRAGIFRMVMRFAPDDIRDALFQRAGRVQFTGATEAYLALMLGHLPMLVAMVLLGCLGGLVAYYVQDALRVGSLPGTFFALFILSNFTSMMNQASFWQLLGARALVYIAAMLTIDLIFRMVLTRRTPPEGRRRGQRVSAVLQETI